MARLRGSVALALLLSSAVGPGSASAQQGQPPGHGNGPRARVSVAPARASKPPVVDGELDDEVWSASAPIAGFVQREPAEGSSVSERNAERLGNLGEPLHRGLIVKYARQLRLF